MTYKSPEYHALARNVAKQEAMLRQIDRARSFNLMKYASDVKLVGKDRDGRAVEAEIPSGILGDILELGVQRCVESAKAIHQGEWEANDFDKAAKV